MYETPTAMVHYEPRGAVGQVVIHWCNGGWYCQNCGLSAPKSVMEWLSFHTVQRGTSSPDESQTQAIEDLVRLTEELGLYDDVYKKDYDDT